MYGAECRESHFPYKNKTKQETVTQKNIPTLSKTIEEEATQSVKEIEDVCDICGTKTKSGHVKCKLCGQWKHVKWSCVG